jgi:cytoskeletal protein CcmA (bactofilin family)
MDPNQQPTDENSQTPEPASLESSAGESLESANADSPTTISPNNGGAPSPESNPNVPEPPREHGFKRIWRKVNVYLLLFLLVVVVLIATTVALYLKNRSNDNIAKNDAAIASQSLSSSALQQLAKNGVQVGDPKQTLNIQSNSVFSGAVLIRGELQVAGGLKIGSGSLSVPGLNVTGSASINKLQTQDLAVAGNGAIQGQLTVQKNLSVNGSGTFNGPLSATQISVGRLQLTGDLTLTHHLIAGGSIPGRSNGGALGGGGSSSVSGSDTAGSISIHTGSGPGSGCFVTINFTEHFSSTPHIVVTPVGSAAAGLNYYITRTTTNFSVCTTNSAPGGSSFGFDYIAFD